MSFLKGQYLTNIPSKLYLLKALGYYTQGRLYHQAVLKAPHRYDLQGNPNQEITDTERAYAQEQLELLEKRYQKWQEKKKRETAVKHDYSISQTTALSSNPDHKLEEKSA